MKIEIIKVNEKGIYLIKEEDSETPVIITGDTIIDNLFGVKKCRL